MSAITNMRRLWVHEIFRVFGDRLIDDEDVSWLVEQIRVTLRDRMNVIMDKLFEDLVPSEKAKGSKNEASLDPPTLLRLLKCPPSLLLAFFVDVASRH